MDKLPISLCVVTSNSADRIGQMLEKHKGIVSEILVVVQNSKDDTFKIAQKYADFVFKKTNKGAADPDRNWLFSIARFPWVLYLDDDEYLPSETVQVLPELLNANVDIYWLKTKNIVDGVDIKSILGDDPHPRLFKLGALRYNDQETNLDHTFPSCAENAKSAYVNYSIVHDRTLKKIKESNRARNRIATDKQIQMQENFIRYVEELLDNQEN